MAGAQPIANGSVGGGDRPDSDEGILDTSMCESYSTPQARGNRADSTPQSRGHGDATISNSQLISNSPETLAAESLELVHLSGNGGNGLMSVSHSSSVKNLMAASNNSDMSPTIPDLHAYDNAVSQYYNLSSLSLPQNSQSGTAYYNWQASKSTVKDRLLFVYKNETMSDVHFIVGKGRHQERIAAHKFILSVSSAVFDAMFNGGMATSDVDIELPDIEPAAFKNLLRFVYSDELSIEAETVMTTLYAAKKYAIPALEKACVDFLKTHLNAENAFMLLTQARLFDEDQLAQLCLEMIDKNTCEALSAEGFIDIDLDTLSVVLQRDTLGIRECKLFPWINNWALAECDRQSIEDNSANRRQVLGSSLYLIRFPLMSVEEFAVGPAQSGLLTDRELVKLFLYFTVNPKPDVPFSDTPRCCLTGKEQVVSRFCQTEHRWGYSGTSDRIRFMVNRKLFLVGFGLYGSIHGPTDYECSIQVIHTDTGKVCGHNDIRFQCDGTNSTFRVMFKEPVEIWPNTNYTACATLKGPDSFYGTKGLRKVTHESLADGKVTFQFTYAAGNNNGTSVEDGQIPELIFYSCHAETKNVTGSLTDKKSARVLPSSNIPV